LHKPSKPTPATARFAGQGNRAVALGYRPVWVCTLGRIGYLILLR